MVLIREKTEMLEKVLKDGEFSERASKISTAEELQRLFTSYGLELTMDEVVTFCEMVAQEKERQEANGEELSAGDLEDVAGGGFLFVAGCIGLGVIAIGGLAIGIVNGYKKNA